MHPWDIYNATSGEGETFETLTATLHPIYQARIQPHFDYCNIIWGNCEICLRNKLQKLENRAAGDLTFSNYDVEAGHLFKLVEWKNLTIQQQIQRATRV